jgi:hypothetical protein
MALQTESNAGEAPRDYADCLCLSVPRHVHPLVADFFRRMMAKRCTYTEAAAKIGCSAGMLLHWRTMSTPLLPNFAAAVEALGGRLVVVWDSHEKDSP